MRIDEVGRYRLNDVNELMQLMSKFREFHRAVVEGK